MELPAFLNSNNNGYPFLMSHFYSSTLFAFILILIASCSSTQQTTQQTDAEPAEPETSSIYPAWFSSQSEFVDSDSTFSAYGLAVAADSNSAYQQAVVQAKSNLEKHLSDRIESARSAAAQSNEALAERSFIFALRQAEASISEGAEIVERTSKGKEDLSSFNGFAKVQITKENLSTLLGEELSSNKNAWEALKASQAFGEL